MKKSIFPILLCALLAPSVTLFAQKSSSKTLVAYFTLPEPDGVDASTGASRMVVDGKLYGTTHYVATIFAEATGGDLHEIKTVHQYPDNRKALLDYARKEAENKTYPALASKLTNLSNYDVIYIGYPNWYYDMPMPIYTFLQQYDLSGKTVIPFCTHGGSGFSKSVENIEALAPKATVKRGPAISRSRLDNVRNAILTWVKENPVR